MKRLYLLILGLFVISTLPAPAGMSMVPGDPAQPMDSQTSVFQDVANDSVNYQAIKYLKDNQIVNGYADGSFQPESFVNRAEFTKMVLNALSGAPGGKDCFLDVKNEWFAPYVCEAKKLGIVSGYDNGEFKPGQTISFSESAKILVNAFHLSKGQDDLSLWYKPFVEGLAGKRAIPLSVEFFDEELTRGELSEMLWRVKAGPAVLSSRSYAEINGEGPLTGMSCPELYDRLSTPSSYQSYKGGFTEAMAPTVSDAAMPTTGGGGAGYSTTNVQVAGVDEADIIKNDGKYIYLIKGDTIRIVEAYPSENMQELVKVKMGNQEEGFYPFDMYVSGDTMVVTGNSYPVYTYDAPAESSSVTESTLIRPYYNTNRTRTYILDIMDRKNPKVTRTLEFEGNYTTSRKIGDTVYLVLNVYPNLYPVPYSYQSDPTAPAAVSPEQVMPLFKDSKDGVDKPLVNCGEVVILPKEPAQNLVMVAAVPLKDPQREVARKVMVASSENVYVSTHNLYLTATDWSGGYKIAQDTQSTAIYKFSLADNAVQLSAQGRVKGRVLNQFSMDEQGDYFRIATNYQGSDMSTDWQWQSRNNLYVLDASLSLVGAVEDLAPGETIYAARFIGNRGYIVTYRQIDPLFVVDLSDPQSPRVAGQLKIPGFSTYLHPYDQNHLIGFGTEVEEPNGNLNGDPVRWQNLQGMKLVLFDVTDINHPQAKFTEVIGHTGTSSDVLYNHKALLFDQAKNLLAFPITVVEMTEDSCSVHKYSTCPASCQKICVPSSCTIQNGIQICTTDCEGANSCTAYEYPPGKTVFQGAYVYSVDAAKGFQLKGKVSHYTPAELEGARTSDYWNADYTKAIQRILYIGENLYTVSQAMIKASNLTTLADKKIIQLGGE